MSHKHFLVLLLMLLLPACTSQVAQLVPTTTAPAATAITAPTVAPTATITFTIEPTSTATPTPTATRTTEATPNPTPLSSPEPTPGPIKQMLIEFGGGGGDGGTNYDLLLGRQMPDLVLYADGQLLIKGSRHGAQDWYQQKRLTTPEMCDLLTRIRATGFFEVPGNGENYPNDPIYVEPKAYGLGGGGYVLSVSGKPSKDVFIYGSAVDNLVPQVKAAYQLVKNYYPTGMKAYVPDRVVVRVEREPAQDWHEPLLPPLPWPADLPSLAAMLQGQSEGREAVFRGQSASHLLGLVQLPGWGQFTEKGQTFFVVGRPLLPHETLNYYSEYTDAQSFDLPFTCAK